MICYNKFMADEKQKLILVVDDEPDLLKTYQIKLERSGFKVITASNGKEGVDAAAANHPDLVLMDVKMPVMDGATAQQEILNNPATKDIKVVFLTAFSDPTRPEVDERLAKETGAVDFIIKGFNLDELVSRVRGYLGMQ